VRTLVVQAQLLRNEGRLDEAVRVLRQATARPDSSAAVQADDEGRAYMRAGVANARITLAQICDHTNPPSLNRPEDALREYGLAERTLRELLAQKAQLEALDRAAVPGDPSTEAYVLHQIGAILGGRALVRQKQENLVAMRTEAEAAVLIRQRNVAREPKNVAWRDGLMTEANTLSIALIRLGEWPAALETSTLAWQTAEALAHEEGPKSKWAGSNPFLAAQYGRALAGNGHHAQALPVFDLGLRRWQAVLQRGPNPNAARRVAWHQVQRAASMAALGQRAAATALAGQAVAALAPLAGDAAVGRAAQLTLAEGHALLARLQPERAAGHRAAAVVALRAAQAQLRLGADHERLLATLN